MVQQKKSNKSIYFSVNNYYSPTTLFLPRFSNENIHIHLIIIQFFVTIIESLEIPKAFLTALESPYFAFFTFSNVDYWFNE